MTKTPDFTKVPNLETLILESCGRLTEVHPSVGVLHHLVTLNLKDCKHLEKLPKRINLKALKTLILSGCSKLSEFPEIVGEMNNLSELDLHGTAIRDLPVSIGHLTGRSKYENGAHIIESNNKFGSVADSTIGTSSPMPEEHIDQLLPEFFQVSLRKYHFFPLLKINDKMTRFHFLLAIKFPFLFFAGRN